MMLHAIVFACACGWLANLCISIHAHRALAHRAVVLHPAVSHIMRFCIWLTTGTKVRRWVAVHRKHHAHVDEEGDPHSPVLHGLARVFFGVYFYYRREAYNAETLARFGEGCPDDWLERHLYGERGWLGLLLLWSLDVLLFEGPAVGVAMGLQTLSMLLWAGVINGVGHHFGYRNFETRDASHNIVPVAVVIGGEELHNNHHRFPRSACFAARPWEVDVGWLVIRLLAALGLASELWVFGARHPQGATTWPSKS
jgi:stearoyl-CoA desaturase (delta-9 desaturase)